MTRREQLGLGTAGIWSEFFRRPVSEWYERVQAEEVPPADWREVVRRGRHPTAAHELDTEEERSFWFAGYVRRRAWSAISKTCRPSRTWSISAA